MTTDIIVGFPGETEADFEQTLSLLDVVGYDAVFAFGYSPRPNTPAIGMAETVPEDIKAARLQRLLDAQRERQRISYERHVGQVMEVMVEGYNRQRGQITGRSSQNKTVNFTTATPILPAIGSYGFVRVTQAYPNSLVGEAVQSPLGMPSGRLAPGRKWMVHGMSGEKLASDKHAQQDTHTRRDRSSHPRSHDGPRHQHAHDRPQRHRRRRGPAHLGRHLRGKRHRTRNRENHHAPAP